MLSDVEFCRLQRESRIMDDAVLHTIWRNRQSRYQPTPLGEPLAYLMQKHLAKRVRQVGRLSNLWDELVPEDLLDHTALESFNRGVLTVMVDSASHRFQLDLALKGGLFRQLQARFNSTLTRVKLTLGQFETVELNA